jgi:hypothetical protein
MLEHEISKTLVPGENLPVVGRDTSCHTGFQGRKRVIFFQISLFSLIEETHVSLQRNLSVLEAGASNTLFHCVD